MVGPFVAEGRLIVVAFAGPVAQCFGVNIDAVVDYSSYGLGARRLSLGPVEAGVSLTSFLWIFALNPRSGSCGIAAGKRPLIIRTSAPGAYGVFTSRW